MYAIFLQCTGSGGCLGGAVGVIGAVWVGSGEGVGEKPQLGRGWGFRGGVTTGFPWHTDCFGTLRI